MMLIEMKPKKNNIWLVLAVPFMVASCFMLFCIIHYGVNTPYWDEWEMVPIFQKVDNGTLSFNDLWSQHNEHRIFFPNVVLITSAYLTHWNVKAELVISFTFSLATALMLYLFILNKVKRPALAVLAAVLSSAWFYSPVQYDNWLWGWQVEWFMCVCGAVLTIYLLDRYATTKSKHVRALLSLSMVSAFIATFSLGSGMFVWIVGLGILMVYRQPPKVIGIWLTGFALSVAAYFYHYHKPTADPSTTLFLHHPVQFFIYVFSYFGRPVSGNADVAILVGSILLFILIPVLYLVWCKRSEIQKFVPWLGLIALSLMAGTITAISRLGFGVEQSLSSRYTAFSLLYIIGLTCLICTLLNTIKSSRSTLRFIILAALAISGPLLFSSYRNGMAGLRSVSNQYTHIKYCTRQPSQSEACLVSTYPRTNDAKTRLDYTKSKHWAGY